MTNSHPEPGLTEAIQMIHAGFVEEARQYLIVLLQNNPELETGWLWLAETASSKDERISDIRLGLANNPNSQQLKTALNTLQDEGKLPPKTDPFVTDDVDAPESIAPFSKSVQPFVEDSIEEEIAGASPREPWMNADDPSIDPSLAALFGEVISEEEFEELKKERSNRFETSEPMGVDIDEFPQDQKDKPDRSRSRGWILGLSIFIILFLCIGGVLIFRAIDPTGFSNSLQSVTSLLPDNSLLPIQGTPTEDDEPSETVAPIVVSIDTATPTPTPTDQPTETLVPESDLTSTAESQAIEQTATQQSNLPILTEITWERIRIDHFFSEAWDVQAGDLDNDGDTDIVASARKSGHLAWYVNDGSHNFTKNLIDTDLGGASELMLFDLDQDGHLDILACASYADDLVWFRNNGTGTFTKTVIDRIDFPSGLDIYDIDEDGDYDIFTVAMNQNLVLWYENDGNQNFTSHEIDTFESATHIIVEDLDQDGDGDVLAAGDLSNIIAWWQNNGEQNFSYNLVDDDVYAARQVEVADLDADGDPDIIGGAGWGSEMYWWENTGESQAFIRHIVDGSYTSSRDVQAVDLDRDGDLDLISCSDGNENKLVWWTNNGAQIFTREVISDDFPGGKNLTVIDLDQDGDLDIIGTALGAGDVIWFENVSE